MPPVAVQLSAASADVLQVENNVDSLNLHPPSLIKITGADV